jgi:hypothetical protein
MVYPKKFKLFVEQTIDYLQEILYLRMHTIKIVYNDHRDGEIEADITPDIQYLRATISIYPCVLKDWPKDTQRIKEILLHEMTHIIIDTIKASNADEETSACWLTKILLRENK